MRRRAARLTRAQVVAALRRARRRDIADKAGAIPAAVGSEQLRQPTALTAPYDGHRPVPNRGDDPEAEIYQYQPGLAAIVGARVLGEFADQPDRYASARKCKNFGGTGTRASRSWFRAERGMGRRPGTRPAPSPAAPLPGSRQAQRAAARPIRLQIQCPGKCNCRFMCKCIRDEPSLCHSGIPGPTERSNSCSILLATSNVELKHLIHNSLLLPTAVTATGRRQAPPGNGPVPVRLAGRRDRRGRTRSRDQPVAVELAMLRFITGALLGSW